MKNSLLKLIKYAIIIAIFYYMFKEINYTKLIDAATEYSIIWFLIAMFTVILSDFCLAIRWRYLTQNKCTLLASFEAIVISGFLNFLLPAKLGELSKIIYLKKLYNFKMNNTLSILILERLFDVFMLGILTILATTFFVENVNANYYATIVVFGTICFFLLLNSRFMISIIKFFPIKYIRVNFLKIRNNMSKQFSLLGSILLFVYSSIVWISYFLTAYVFLVYVADFNLTLLQVLVVFIISSIAMSIPIMPGGVGTYQASIIFALDLYSINKEEALIAGIMLHLILLIPSFLAALVVIENKNLSIESLKKVKI